MAANRGPLGDLPGLTFDPARNRYFPTREEDTPKQSSSDGSSLRNGSFQQRLKRGRQGDRSPRNNNPSTRPPNETHGRGSKKSAGDQEGKKTRDGKVLRGKRSEIPEQELLSADPREPTTRLDRTLLRATGLQLGPRDRFPGPTSAEAQRRKRRERSLMYSRMASITAEDEPTFPSTLTVMATIPDQPSSILLGDHMGSIHAVKMEYDLPDWEIEVERASSGWSFTPPPRYRRWLWQEINLGKRITGIRATSEHYIATTFGPRPRIVVSQLPAMLSAFDTSSSQPPSMFDEEKPTVLWELTKMQDVWSMDSVGTSVIVGGNQQIVYAQDIINPQFRSIRTPGDSDALSVCQINTNEALVGLRSSAILHYDFRLPDSSAVATRLEIGKSVCGIKFLDESGAAGRSLIASGYTHQLALFDLRFPKNGPVQRYSDHVNDYRSGLGLAVDPSQTHVFAAGSDQIIRAWSIWDGQPVHDLAQRSGTKSRRRLLGEQQPAAVSGIEVYEEDKIHILNDRQLETFMQY